MVRGLRTILWRNKICGQIFLWKKECFSLEYQCKMYIKFIVHSSNLLFKSSNGDAPSTPEQIFTHYLGNIRSDFESYKFVTILHSSEELSTLCDRSYGVH